MINRILINKLTKERFIVLDTFTNVHNKMIYKIALERYKDQKFANYVTFKQLNGLFYLTKADKVLYGD